MCGALLLGALVFGAVALGTPPTLSRREAIAVQRAALLTLFVRREQARRLVFWSDTAHASPTLLLLRAIGLSEAQARSSIRLGFGRYTTEDELVTAIDRILAVAAAQRLAA